MVGCFLSSLKSNTRPLESSLSILVTRLVLWLGSLGLNTGLCPLLRSLRLSLVWLIRLIGLVVPLTHPLVILCWLLLWFLLKNFYLLLLLVLLWVWFHSTLKIVIELSLVVRIVLFLWHCRRSFCLLPGFLEYRFWHRFGIRGLLGDEVLARGKFKVGLVVRVIDNPLYMLSSSLYLLWFIRVFGALSTSSIAKDFLCLLDRWLLLIYFESELFRNLGVWLTQTLAIFLLLRFIDDWTLA